MKQNIYDNEVFFNGYSKIRENENSNPFGQDDQDEFDKFDYDASKSAFKPLDKKPEDTGSVNNNAGYKPEPPKASDKTDFEQVAPVNDPAFKDGNIDFEEFTGVKEDKNTSNQKLFDAGQDLDFAASSNSSSSFTGGSDDEFALDEDAMAINPFKAAT